MIRAIVRHRLLIPLVALLVIGTIAGQLLAEREDSVQAGPSLFSRDKSSSGALALAMWLDQLGYRVSRVEGAASVPDAQIQLTFVLSPSRRFSRLEADGLREWVQAGGVLIYQPRNLPSRDPAAPPGDGLVDRLGLEVRGGTASRRATVVLPILSRPDVSDLEVNATNFLDLHDEAWVPLLRDGDRIVAATRALGRGRVYGTSSTIFFQNDSIGLAQSSDFVLGILARHPQVTTVAFDEYHHGIVAAPSLTSVMRASPWGWAIAYGLLVSFLFIVWAGRRFGPPIIPVRAVGRSTGDYVTSLAGMIQRARASGWAQAQYARLVRRSLSRILGVRADLPIPALAQVLEGRRGADSARLAEHVRALEGPPIGERALLNRARDVERQLRALQGLEGG